MINDLFLSYKHGAEDAPEEGIVTEYILRFKLASLKVWAFHDHKRNIKIREAVKNLQIFVLFLTKNVFKEKAVIVAARQAVKLKKQIVLLYHPDTEKANYCSYDHYTSTCPDDLQALFNATVVIKLERSLKLADDIAQDVMLLIIKTGSSVPEKRNQYQIFVRNLTGKMQQKLSIRVDAQMSIYEIKKNESKIDVPVKKQRLVFAGKYLTDNLTLIDYNIKRDCLIHLILRPPSLVKDHYEIFVKTIDGRTLSLFVHKNLKIIEIKRLLSMKCNACVESMRLLKAGSDMKEDRELADYDVTKGTTLHMLMRLTGC